MKYPLLEEILAESEDRREKPAGDTIYEVLPLKWKKAKKGQAQPLNFPMNPKAKDFDSLPEGYEHLKTMLAEYAEAGKDEDLAKLAKDYEKYRNDSIKLFHEGDPAAKYMTEKAKELHQKMLVLLEKDPAALKQYLADHVRIKPHKVLHGLEQYPVLAGLIKEFFFPEDYAGTDIEEEI